jgi:hypothetical protein
MPEKFTGLLPTMTIDPPILGDFSFCVVVERLQCPNLPCNLPVLRFRPFSVGIHQRNTKPRYGRFGAFSTAWSKKAGANTGRTAHSRKPVKTCHFRLYVIPPRSALKRERTERKPLARTDQNPAQNGHKKRTVLSFAVMYKKGAIVDIC